jgi:hypothetical protein
MNRRDVVALGGQVETALREWLAEGVSVEEMQARLHDGGLPVGRVEIDAWIKELR